MAEVTIDKNAEEIKIPPEVTELTPYLFSGCSALKKAVLPVALNGFPEGLFQGCESLVDIPFRAGIQEILPKTFEGCKSLKSIVFPNTINAIRSRACADCTSLQTVVLPPKMYALADDAFDGCNNIHNIRIDEANKLFYINEEDGCLYERNVEGPDILKIRLAGVTNAKVAFFKENVDQEAEPFFTDENIYEEDDTFFSSIEAGSDMDEADDISITDEVTATCEEVASIENKNAGESKMSEENNVNDMLADIMGQEKERNEVVSEEIGVSAQESEMLSTMMDVMDDAPAAKGAAVSDDELANLFESHEQEATAQEETVVADDQLSVLDSKTKILVESVKNSKVLTFEKVENPREDFDLFVIAEKADFSAKLIACVEKIARVQDIRRVILLSGLPLDNDEFMQFYFHFISNRNVLVACEAQGPSTLSDYGKTICEQSRISLDRETLIEQRKQIAVRNSNLIKLIIRDVE